MFVPADWSAEEPKSFASIKIHLQVDEVCLVSRADVNFGVSRDADPPEPSVVRSASVAMDHGGRMKSAVNPGTLIAYLPAEITGRSRERAS
jgi:hypothetical protein